VSEPATQKTRKRQDPLANWGTLVRSCSALRAGWAAVEVVRQQVGGPYGAAALMTGNETIVESIGCAAVEIGRQSTSRACLSFVRRIPEPRPPLLLLSRLRA